MQNTYFADDFGGGSCCIREQRSRLWASKSGQPGGRWRNGTIKVLRLLAIPRNGLAEGVDTMDAQCQLKFYGPKRP